MKGSTWATNASTVSTTALRHLLPTAGARDPSPRPRPRPAAGDRDAPPPRARPRARGAARSSGIARRRPRRPKTVRIYHVTHVENLGSHPRRGRRARRRRGRDTGRRPVGPRRARVPPLGTTVDGADAVVADYVPFLLSTDAHVWDAVRTGTPDPRLADEAVERAPADHVILVSSVAGRVGARTDGAGHGRRDRRGCRGRRRRRGIRVARRARMLQRLHREDEGRACARRSSSCASSCPLERVALIAVGNDRVRDRVRAALDAVGAQDPRGGLPAVVPGDGEEPAE